MKVLVIGGGGREHAMAWCLAKSKRVTKVFITPGNGGTAARLPRPSGLAITNAAEHTKSNAPIENIALDPVKDPQSVADFVKRNDVKLTVVGPEAPLAAGIVDIFRKEQLPIFGPTKACAQLESSKDFAKRFMKEHGIPTAEFETFSDAEKAKAYIHARGAPIVVKADGLAAGKGVVVAMTEQEAIAAVDMMLLDNKFGDAGARVVVEEFLEGEEASFIVMCDGKSALAMATSQDHKRLLNQDQGPNTGGMGAYSPAPVVTPEIHARVLREVINPVLKGMAAKDTPYTGFLYAGLMISPNGAIKVLEFNCRMGDPETQPIFMRLKTDFTVLLEAAIAQQLDQTQAEWDSRTALGVVIAAHGYPDSVRTGDAITELPLDTDDCVTFHAGTTMNNGQVVTSGGRVLCVTALGGTPKLAQTRAYEAVNQVKFSGMQYRSDIGYRAIKT
ncbi:MAG: phosphoribosylamine--glycine ligase [Burkholderiaceae bacterium]|nr:phosphoribosylamine--glycine ligase [Burkholderiaceae bacterium]